MGRLTGIVFPLWRNSRRRCGSGGRLRKDKRSAASAPTRQWKSTATGCTTSTPYGSRCCKGELRSRRRREVTSHDAFAAHSLTSPMRCGTTLLGTRWDTLLRQLRDFPAIGDLQPLERGKAVEPRRQIYKIVATLKSELLQGREELKRSLLFIREIPWEAGLQSFLRILIDIKLLK
ncbi:hypothetical protein E2562_016828 [Oryza meyeriana var. granulata]|uniref:Uncharacterized protein n=1 Tax=Oryza meyeriana var. granulata TaxID=110450 RepID=A0A6G1BXV4_9ORYZ|nr:hypothetical protein E2562_016828 [Oryza meyeriana var. granulata]